jgi:hypothetical protein
MPAFSLKNRDGSLKKIIRRDDSESSMKQSDIMKNDSYYKTNSEMSGFNSNLNSQKPAQYP